MILRYGAGGINAAVGEINRPNTCAFGSDRCWSDAVIMGFFGI